MEQPIIKTKFERIESRDYVWTIIWWSFIVALLLGSTVLTVRLYFRVIKDDKSGNVKESLQRRTRSQMILIIMLFLIILVYFVILNYSYSDYKHFIRGQPMIGQQLMGPKQEGQLPQLQADAKAQAQALAQLQAQARV